jgi:pyruvate dehydrogenase E1 component alpha subunit
MLRAATTAVDRARSGGGPTLLEAVTYRFHGHLMGDDMAYMPTEEREAAMDADPVPRFRALMVERGHATDAELSAIESDNATRIDEAVEFALAAEEPDPSELEDDVYATVIR